MDEDWKMIIAIIFVWAEINCALPNSLQPSLITYWQLVGRKNYINCLWDLGHNHIDLALSTKEKIDCTLFPKLLLVKVIKMFYFNPVVSDSIVIFLPGHSLVPNSCTNILSQDVRRRRQALRILYLDSATVSRGWSLLDRMQVNEWT